MNLKKASVLTILLVILGTATSQAQKSIADLLQQHNAQVVPYMSVQELAMPKTNPIVLDARELSEFNVSHLKNAFFVGYNDFDINRVSEEIPNKDQSIVVYCSLGIRSEHVAHQLQKAGYTNVQNLYGGIFEWKNNGFPVFNSAEKETDSVHAFSKVWGKWLNHGIKVYAK